jgi:hypothetical protein
MIKIEKIRIIIDFASAEETVEFIRSIPAMGFIKYGIFNVNHVEAIEKANNVTPRETHKELYDLTDGKMSVGSKFGNPHFYAAHHDGRDIDISSNYGGGRFSWDIIINFCQYGNFNSLLQMIKFILNHQNQIEMCYVSVDKNGKQENYSNPECFSFIEKQLH